MNQHQQYSKQQQGHLNHQHSALQLQLAKPIPEPIKEDHENNSDISNSSSSLNNTYANHNTAQQLYFGQLSAAQANQTNMEQGEIGGSYGQVLIINPDSNNLMSMNIQGHLAHNFNNESSVI